MEKLHFQKRAEQKLEIMILLIACFRLFIGNTLMADDTIRVSDPVAIEVNHTKLVAYSDILECNLAIANWDDSDPPYSHSIYQIDTDYNASVFLTDSLGTVDRFTFLGDNIFTVMGGAIKGYDCFTQEQIFYMEPYYACGIQGGITSVGDSLIFTTDPEWDQLFKVNVKTNHLDIIEVEGDEYWGLWTIAYDEFRNRLLVANQGPQLITIDLTDNFEISLMETGIYDYFHHILGLITDIRGNIYTTHFDTSGVYMLPEGLDQVIKITDLPENPGYLSYNKSGNFLLVPDMETFELYTIWLNSTPNDIDSDGAQGNADERKSQLYPNPANSYFSVTFTLSSPTMGRIDMYNGNGQRISSFPDQLWHEGKNVLIIDKAELSVDVIQPGIYHLILSGDNINQNLKVTIID